MIDFSLTERQKELRENIIDFAQRNLNENVEERDEKGIFLRDLWEKCGEIKLPGLSVPEEFGGAGASAVDVVVALEALGYGSRDGGFNFSLAAHLLACVMPIVEYGTEEQKKQLLPKLCDGTWIATNAMTELSAGSDVYKMKSTATMEGGGYLLNGLKSYCSNGPISDLVITYCLTDESKGVFGGISCFILEEGKHDYIKTPPEHKLGYRTCQMGMIEMKDTLVDESALLAKPGAGTVIFNRSMEWERICLGALHIGNMAYLLEECIDFVKKRTSGGKPIGSYQAISHKIAELYSSIEAARLVIMNAAWKLDNKQGVTREAAMAKNAASVLYKRFCLEIGQIYGGYVFRGRHALERSLRESIGATVYSGTTEIQHAIIARTLGLRS